MGPWAQEQAAAPQPAPRWRRRREEEAGLGRHDLSSHGVRGFVAAARAGLRRWSHERRLGFILSHRLLSPIPKSPSRPRPRSLPVVGAEPERTPPKVQRSGVRRGRLPLPRGEDLWEPSARHPHPPLTLGTALITNPQLWVPFPSLSFTPQTFLGARSMAGVGGGKIG